MWRWGVIYPSFFRNGSRDVDLDAFRETLGKAMDVRVWHDVEVPVRSGMQWVFLLYLDVEYGRKQREMMGEDMLRRKAEKSGFIGGGDEKVRMIWFGGLVKPEMLGGWDGSGAPLKRQMREILAGIRSMNDFGMGFVRGGYYDRRQRGRKDDIGKAFLHASDRWSDAFRLSPVILGKDMIERWSGLEWKVTDAWLAWYSGVVGTVMRVWERDAGLRDEILGGKWEWCEKWDGIRGELMDGGDDDVRKLFLVGGRVKKARMGGSGLWWFGLPWMTTGNKSDIWGVGELWIGNGGNKNMWLMENPMWVHPRTLMKRDWMNGRMRPEDWGWSWKADGEHTWLDMDEDGKVWRWMGEGVSYSIPVRETDGVQVQIKNADIRGCRWEGEWMEKERAFYIFDGVRQNGRWIGNLPSWKRWEIGREIWGGGDGLFLLDGVLSGNVKDGVEFYWKPSRRGTEVDTLVKMNGLLEKELDEALRYDGWILTGWNDQVRWDMVIWKWKPAKFQTIDAMWLPVKEGLPRGGGGYMVVRRRGRGINRNEVVRAEYGCQERGGRVDGVVAVRWMKADTAGGEIPYIDGAYPGGDVVIGEFRWKGWKGHEIGERRWEMVRRREDKEMLWKMKSDVCGDRVEGVNALGTAESVDEALVHPLSFSEMLQ